MAETTQNSFADITGRMDEIISTVRSKDTSLERSLDLFDEAIALGARAVELVDSFDMSPEEAAQLEAAAAGSDAPDAAEPAGDGSPAEASDDAPDADGAADVAGARDASA